MPCLELDFEGPGTLWKMHSSVIFMKITKHLEKEISELKGVKNLNTVIERAHILVQNMAENIQLEYKKLMPDR